jgi:hypothetical protein
MARRGTEFFSDLGAHCDEAECNQQLEFLPFECDGCGGFFCAAHRTYRDHGCAKAADPGRTVVLCPDCGDSVERTAPGQAERDVLDAHARSGRCDQGFFYRSRSGNRSQKKNRCGKPQIPCGIPRPPVLPCRY